MPTPPDSFLNSWASSGVRSTLARAKQAKGYTVGEAPGASHLNYMVDAVGTWQRAFGKALAPQIAFNNIDYTTTSIGPAAAVDSMHIDFDPLANKFYTTGIDTAGNVYATSSADGVTWETTVYPVNVGAGSYGDASKIVSNGTVCAIAADNGTQAKVYTSSDLLVANFDAGTNVGTSTTALESSDLVYDEGNSLWIWGGRSTTTGRIFTATTPTGTWTSRLVSAGTDIINLATNGAGTSFAQTDTGQGYYSTNGTTWTASTTSPAVANNCAWSSSLGLFVILENATGDLWTSADGDNWTDMNATESIPPFFNLVHCEDFVFAWTENLGPSTNTQNYYDVYVFHTAATDRSNFSYSKIGTAWGAESIAFNDRQRAVYRCGQGKMLFPYSNATPANGTYLALSQYGAPDAI